MATYNAVITNDGRNLFAQATAGGGTVIPVRVNTGDGTLGATDPTTLSNLIHLVQSYAINSSNALVPYQATFQFQIDSTTVTTTYALREIGLIGKIGSGGAETLIYYSSTSDAPDTITPSTGNSAVIDFNTLTIAFSNTPNTVATLTAAVPPPLHAISHLHRTDGSSPDPIPTANSSDYGLCPSTPNDATKVLIGGATAAFGPVPVHAPRHVGGAADPLPLSTTAASGALRALSGDATTVLNGTGNWGAGFFPGFITEYGGGSAPAGWLLCDGTPYLTASYPALFAAIGYLHGGGGGVFNVPDCRGRATVGAGNGPGLTPRGMGAQGGEEQHTLSPAEMPYHTHGVNDPGHAHSVYDPSHAHSVADGGHAHGVYDPQHIHGVGDPGHAHSIADPGHHHQSFYEQHYYNPSGVQGGAGYNWTAHWQDTTAVGTGIGIYAAATGVYLGYAATRIGIYAAGTGIGIYGAYTGIGIYGAYTGISIQYNGGNVPHNNLQPFVVLQKIIKT